MNIVVSSDRNYVMHLATLVSSICENNRNVNKITVHWFSNNIPEPDVRNILDLESKYKNFCLRKYDISDALIERYMGCKIYSDRGLSAFARLFIPDILSQDIDKALYLDVDAIVVSSLSELFELDIQEHYLAAVMDTNALKKRLSIGLKKDDIYFNSGLLLWNLKKCRLDDVTNKFRYFVSKREGLIDSVDQGVINATISDCIYTLHPRWNVMTTFFQMSSTQLQSLFNVTDFYSQKELDEATSSPVFIHYTPAFTTRPWSKNCKHPQKETYWKYRKMTPYSGMLMNDQRRIKVRIVSWMFTFMPFFLFKFFTIKWFGR